MPEFNSTQFHLRNRQRGYHGQASIRTPEARCTIVNFLEFHFAVAAALIFAFSLPSVKCTINCFFRGCSTNSLSHDSHELHDLWPWTRVRHQLGEFHVRTHLLRDEPLQVGGFLFHRLCMSTCFALPSRLRLTRPIVAWAPRCRFNRHAMATSFATLWIPNPSDAVLTAACSSLTAADSDTTCCFLVHFQTVPASHDHSS